MDCSHSLRLQLQNKVSHLKHPENLSASICSIWLVLKENSKHREKHLKFGNNNFLQIYFPKEARSITFVAVFDLWESEMVKGDQLQRVLILSVVTVTEPVVTAIITTCTAVFRWTV